MIEALKQFVQSIDSESDLTHLQTLQQMIDQLNFAQGQKPKVFANSIGSLLEIVENYSLTITNKQKFELMDIIIVSIEGYPSTIRKNPGRVEKIFDLICRLMANISNQVPQIWLNPPEDYSQQDIVKLEELDPDAALVCKLRSCFDRLSSTVGYMKMVNIVQTKSINLYQIGDWRWKNAVLMCLSQLTQDVQLDKMNNILTLVKMGFNDSHPKVRFAAIQALGQLSDDLKPQFQNKYFNQLMPVIINGLDDTVQRVASHWMACMTNFIQDFTNTVQIIPYMPQLMNKICHYIEFGHNSAKQNSISTLSSLVTIPSLFDKDSIRRPFEICHSVFQTFTVEKHKQLINQTVQCITITISSQPYLIIKDYIPFVVEIINQITDKISPEYLITGWHRICTVGQKFENWKPIFSKVLQVIKATQIHQLSGGFNSILCTVDCFKEDFYPFAFEVLPYIQSSFIKAIQDVQQQTATSAIDAIQQILTKAKPSNPDVNWDNIIKSSFITFSGKVVEAIDNDYFKTCEKILDLIKQLIQNYTHLFGEQEMANKHEHYFAIVQKLQVKKCSILNNQTGIQDDVDEDVLQEKKQDDLKGINNCKLSVPDIIQAIMKISKFQKQFIVIVLNHASQAILKTVDDQDLRYATYYIDNLIEDYDYQMLKQYWQNIYKYLSQFSGKSQASLRNSAIFGIGVFAEKTPIEIVNMGIINTWIEVAKTAFSIPKNQKQSKKVYGHCQDNCVAAIGKILKKYHKNFDLKPLYNKWLMTLPLKYDADENRIQIRNLCDLLEFQPQILIDGGVESINTLKQIVKVFAELVCHLRKKKLNKQNIQVLKRSKQVLLKMNQWPFFKQNQAVIIGSLGQNQQFQLKQLLTNQAVLLITENMK